MKKENPSHGRHTERTAPSGTRNRVIKMSCIVKFDIVHGDDIISDLTIIGSRPSDHYFRSVCVSVCLFVQSFSQLSSIGF